MFAVEDAMDGRAGASKLLSQGIKRPDMSRLQVVKAYDPTAHRGEQQNGNTPYRNLTVSTPHGIHLARIRTYGSKAIQFWCFPCEGSTLCVLSALSSEDTGPTAGVADPNDMDLRAEATKPDPPAPTIEDSVRIDTPKPVL